MVALSVAPELFNPGHALKYLKMVEKELISDNSIGIGTLGSEHDSLYVPYYNNNDDSSDLKVAHGFSYHNGPEWIWPDGFYIDAKMQIRRD